MIPKSRNRDMSIFWLVFQMQLYILCCGICDFYRVDNLTLYSRWMSLLYILHSTWSKGRSLKLKLNIYSRGKYQFQFGLVKFLVRYIQPIHESHKDVKLSSVCPSKLNQKIKNIFFLKMISLVPFVWRHYISMKL